MNNKKITTILLVSLVILGLTNCKKGFKPNEDKIGSIAINKEISDLLAKAEKATDENEKAKLLGRASELLADKGDSNRSMNVAKQALIANPMNVPALTSIGEFYIKRGQFDEAASVLQEAISYDGTYARAHYLAGNTFYALKKPDDAIRFYKTAISINDKDARCFANLAVALAAKNNLPEAWLTVNRAIAADPGFAMAYKNAGIIAEKMNKIEEAKKMYLEYIRLNPYAEDVEAVKKWAGVN